MNDEKITFIKAENGIIVEITHCNWDGRSTTRKIFIGNEKETLKQAINWVFFLNEIS